MPDDLRTHPLWRPYEQIGAEQAAASVVGAPGRTPERVVLVDSDTGWPRQYEQVAAVVRTALGGRVLLLQHVGSTSVPGLAAKPIIDVDLVVADSADEPSYRPELEDAGFGLVVREPHWFEHRMFRWHEVVANLHVFGIGAVEPARHAASRDWLRTHEDDRAAYARIKRAVAGDLGQAVWQYNNRKSGLIYDIYEKIFRADPEHEHDPHPR